MSKQLNDLEKSGVQHIVYELSGKSHGVTGIPQYGMLSFADWTDSKDRKIRLEENGQLRGLGQGDILTLPDEAIINTTVRKYVDGQEVPMPELPKPATASPTTLVGEISLISASLRELAEQLELGLPDTGALPLSDRDLRVIITGNIIDGMTIWGPFDGPDAADWAHNEFPDQDWLQVALLSPDNKE